MIFNQKEPPIILSVGGSLVVPNGGIDTDFLTKLNKVIREEVIKGKRFFLVIGGGRVMRNYRDAAKTVIGNVSNEDLDWLAIHVTRVNAHLLRTIFQDIATPRIIENYDKKLRNWKEPVVVGAGWKPGWSTDFDAVKLAQDYGAQVIINLSNIDWVYDKDPNKYKDAKPIKRITWDEMQKLVGDKWTPGLNSPFDPIATKLAKKLGLTVIVTNGHDFDNLKKILEGEAFKGTVIMPFQIDASYYDREYYTGKKGGHRFAHAESLPGKLFHYAANFYRALTIKIFLNPKICLEVGCGTGRLVHALRVLGVEAYGVDISQYALEIASPKVKPYMKKGDATNLPYEDNRFDLVVSYDLLQRLERSKIKKAVEETVRVSKKYILHKIYTRENVWIKVFHRFDFSNISFFPKKYWQKVFSSFDNITIVRNQIIRLPSFFETKFLLKKKHADSTD